MKPLWPLTFPMGISGKEHSRYVIVISFWASRKSICRGRIYAARLTHLVGRDKSRPYRCFRISCFGFYILSKQLALFGLIIFHPEMFKG